MKAHTEKQNLAFLVLTAAILFAAPGCEKGVFSLEMEAEEFTLPGKADTVNPGDPTGPQTCTPDDRFFLREVWAPVLEGQCAACHSSQGLAKDTDLVLYNAGWGNYLQNNLQVVKDLARTKRDGESVLLLKATGRISHGGGQLMEVGDENYQRLQAFITRAESDTQCEVANDDEFFQDVKFLDYDQTLRKAALSLVGRAPTQEEYDAAMNSGVDEVLDSMMTEEAFYVRLKESFNDVLHTDMYNRNAAAVDLLDDDIYPNRDWYSNIGDENARNQARARTNTAIAREPLEIIAHVVREDRPFTEILTADYTLVNPYSARAFGLVDGDGNCTTGEDCTLSFADMNDPNEMKEAAIPGIPHAGVLTTTSFLNRYPTTETNRNRTRSGYFYLFFLATDVLRLADRPTDPTLADSSQNPTLFDAQCTVCHEVIDPIAGAFQNWDEQGRYNPRDSGWYTDMLPPGIEREILGQSNNPESLSWLAQRTTADPRFIVSAVEHGFRMLTGDEPLRYPQDPTTASYAAEFHAYEVQYNFFKQVGLKFVESNYNFKTIIKELVKSPYYRAEDAAASIDGMRQLELKSMGTSRLLSPEQLHRKIESLLGRSWRVNNRDLLLDNREFRLLYGGIDSQAILKRMKDPSALASSIARRMGNEMSCLAGPNDFSLDPSERLLFPHVSPDDTLETNEAAIRRNIQHLHFHLLGEKVDVNSEDVDHALSLFRDVVNDGLTNDYGDGLPNMCRSNGVNNDPNYTIRGWMAVVSYMLTDYAFLYE